MENTSFSHEALALYYLNILKSEGVIEIDSRVTHVALKTLSFTTETGRTYKIKNVIPDLQTFDLSTTAGRIIHANVCQKEDNTTERAVWYIYLDLKKIFYNPEGHQTSRFIPAFEKIRTKVLNLFQRKLSKGVEEHSTAASFAVISATHHYQKALDKQTRVEKAKAKAIEKARAAEEQRLMALEEKSRTKRLASIEVDVAISSPDSLRTSPTSQTVSFDKDIEIHVPVGEAAHMELERMEEEKARLQHDLVELREQKTKELQIISVMRTYRLAAVMRAATAKPAAAIRAAAKPAAPPLPRKKAVVEAAPSLGGLPISSTVSTIAGIAKKLFWS